MVAGGGVLGRRRLRTHGQCNGGTHGGGHGGANRYRPRADPGGSARTRHNAHTRSRARTFGSACTCGSTCTCPGASARPCTGTCSALSLSKLL